MLRAQSPPLNNLKANTDPRVSQGLVGGIGITTSDDNGVLSPAETNRTRYPKRIMADSSTCGRKSLEMEVILQSDDNCIMEGDGVILKKDIYLKFVKAMPGRKERMGNCSFFLDKMIGREFGMAYEVEGTQLVNIDPLKYEHEDVDFSEHNDERDNRSINDDSNAQQLSKDDIMSLKNEGVGGQDIIQKIKDSSATFNDKTVYSQAKYLKKKKKK